MENAKKIIRLTGDSDRERYGFVYSVSGPGKFIFNNNNKK